MNGSRPWLVAQFVTIQILLSIANCSKTPHYRRSLIQQGNLPISKGGWRPVIGSGGLLYNPLGTAPLHAPSYKIPVPVLDLYPSSSRPLAARDVTKLTSIAQSYKPTTHRTVSVSNHPLAANQPINSYLNPFALPNNFNNYKFIQNYPVDSVLVRNPNNAYAARPVLQKQQTKQKPQYHNNILQQLTNVQPIQFGQYSTVKPLDIFTKPNAHSRPDGKRPHSAETEIFKPEVFKLGDTDTASQFLSQSVKTAQQQSYTPSKFPINQYGHPFRDTVFPPSILGTFGSFGLQSVKGRDPVYPTTKTTFLPPQTTKQTLFNTYNFSPNFKSTPALFATSTPKLTTAQNYNYFFSSTLNDLGNVPTPQTKPGSSLKIDPNVGTKFNFKASPQDHFIKNFHNFDYNKITTYNPPAIQTSSLASPLFNDYGLLAQNTVFQNYKNQNYLNTNYDKTKQKTSDNVGLTQQLSQQYTSAPGLFDLESSLNALTHAQRPSYAVIENTDDITSHASVAPWTVTPRPHAQNQKPDEPVTSADHANNLFEKPTTILPDLPEEYAIVTESDNNENVYNYDSQVESQSRRPLGDDFEPIGKSKLKEYYYKVSTPTYTEYKPYRRTKKPTEAPKTETTSASYVVKETTEIPLESLPTLPPNRHFKRPSTPVPTSTDKIRKRNKIRRRRPLNRTREETSTHKEALSTEAPTTTAEDIHTIRPRIRPIKTRTETTVTTPNETTELTTSALPTTAPTRPTILKKKMIGHRRPLTTPSDRLETTTQAALVEKDNSRESSIMKISSRPQHSKSPLNSYQFKNNDIPDYSHKQDEKDTPTSDVSVSITDTLRADALKEFSFHRDVRPVEIKESTTASIKDKIEYEITTYAPRLEASSRPVGKISRPRLKNKLDRPKFSVKDYRNRLNSTTSTTEKIEENTPKPRFPQRKHPYTENIFTEIETTTERKKFTPKEPRHKLNRTENNEQEIHSRHASRQKQNSDNAETSTQRISSRIRNGQRRRPTDKEENTETSTHAPHKRPLRKRIQDSDTGESVQDTSVTESGDHRNDITERTKSESAIMKIADKKHHEPIERLFEHSQRVSDLTLAASKDYNTPGMFKTIASNSRRIPSYFTIATDDPILPIEAFFPQLNQKKES